MKKLTLVLVVAMISVGCLFAVSDERLEEIAIELNVPTTVLNNLVTVYNPVPSETDDSVVRVSFSQYLYDYRNNMVEADRKYKGKELEIYNCYGEDMNQAMMNSNSDYYIISGDWTYDIVSIYINRADNHLVSEALGNYFTVRGTQSRISYDILDNCRIVQIGYVNEE